jgi:hypothetical protein
VFYNTFVSRREGETMSGDEKKPLDYGLFLADLEAKRAALDQAITSIRAIMAAGALSGTLGDSAALSPAIPATGGEVPVGAFLGRSIAEAARLCLQIVKRKMTTREIAEALKKGGIETNAKTSFLAIVHSILARSARSGTGIVKLDRSFWGLQEWYPAGMRAVQDKREDRKPRKARRKRAENRKPSLPTVPTKMPSAPPTEGHHPAKLSERAVAFINEHPTQEFTAEQLSEKFGIHAKVISMTLAKPVKQGLIHMSAPRTYAAGGGPLHRGQ